jgi:hypothetical protein
MIQVDDWIQIPEVDKIQLDDTDSNSTSAVMLEKLTAGIYEDTTYARCFWILGTLCLLVEPFLVPYSLQEDIYDTELIIFGISTCLFIMQTLGVMFLKKPWKGNIKKVND